MCLKQAETQVVDKEMDMRRALSIKIIEYVLTNV